MLQHESVIGYLSLDICVHRNDRYFITRRFGALAKAHDNIIRKVMRFFILNIIPLHDNAQFLCRFFVAPQFRISEFHGCFKYLFL